MKMKTGDMSKCINNMTFRFCAIKIWSKFGTLALDKLKSEQKDLRAICNQINEGNLLNLQSIDV